MSAEFELTEMLKRDAAAKLAEFQALIAGVPYERKGILFSEMYFFWLCTRTIKPRESWVDDPDMREKIAADGSAAIIGVGL